LLLLLPALGSASSGNDVELGTSSKGSKVVLYSTGAAFGVWLLGAILRIVLFRLFLLPSRRLQSYLSLLVMLGVGYLLSSASTIALERSYTTSPDSYGTGVCFAPEWFPAAFYTCIWTIFFLPSALLLGRPRAYFDLNNKQSLALSMMSPT
jgi:hypothetical protein